MTFFIFIMMIGWLVKEIYLLKNQHLFQSKIWSGKIYYQVDYADKKQSLLVVLAMTTITLSSLILFEVNV